MKFEIKNYLTGGVIFTAEIKAVEADAYSLKIGLAVRVAVSKKADLSGADLRGAYLSGAYLSGADLSGAYLSGADLRGAYLSDAYLSDADLSDADLSGADLRGAYLRGAYLSGADLRGAYLRGADLRGAYLSGAYLSGAYLSGADLSGADLRGAYLSDAPVVDNIHEKVYAAAMACPELFDMRTFATGSGHTCGTAQCRAGWVLAVAGQDGLELEAKIGTAAAAMSIYLVSDPERWKSERLPNFYCDNTTALADMKRMAGL